MVAVVGLGKMGLSHLSMVRAHPGRRGGRVSATPPATCSTSSASTPVWRPSPTSTRCSTSRSPDAVIIATPTHLHAPMVRAGARARHPRLLREAARPRPARGRRAGRAGRGARARDPGRLPQPLRRHVPRGQAAPRRRRDRPGHTTPGRGLRPGRPQARRAAPGAAAAARAAAASTTTRPTRSTCSPGTSACPGRGRQPAHQHLLPETDDAVSATLYYADGHRAALVNWSDESQRKMTTQITLWGTNGRIYADRQEIQVYLPRHGRRPRRLRRGLERPLHAPSSPSRPGSTCAARSTAPSSRRSSTRGRAVRRRGASTTSLAPRVTDRVIAADPRRRRRPVARRDGAAGRPVAPPTRAPATARRTSVRGRPAAPPRPRGRTRRVRYARSPEDPSTTSRHPADRTPDGPAAVRRQPVLRRQPHVGGEGARAAMRFQDIDAVMEVLDAAYDEGVTTFMCTTHDRVAEICDDRAGQPDALPRHEVLPVHAVRAQVRQRDHRGRHARGGAALPARGAASSARPSSGTRSLAAQGRRGHRHAARSTPR